MEILDAMQYCLEKLTIIGIDKAQCVAQRCEKHELIAAAGEISRLRTTTDTTLHLTGIFDQRQGVVSLNSLDSASLAQAIDRVGLLAKASKPDPACAIADYQPPQEFERGPEMPERDVMYARLAEFLTYCATAYPSCVQRETRLNFTRSHTYIQNSNGVNLAAHQGAYRFNSAFFVQGGNHAVVSNTAAFASAHLDQELRAYGAVDRQIRDTVEQLAAAPLAEKFTGDVILTPESMGTFMAMITEQLRDQAIISGVSPFRHRFREAIASQKFSLHSHPLSEEIADGCLVTPDGYVAQNGTIIGSGTLNTLLLSQYGARLLQKRRSINDGGAYVIDAGGTPLDAMIASMRKGLLAGSLMLCKSNGNGDFSGVAPTCAFIKDGAVQTPLQPIMISGNLVNALQDIRFISRERANFGDAIFPWVQIRNLTAVGK